MDKNKYIEYKKRKRSDRKKARIKMRNSINSEDKEYHSREEIRIEYNRNSKVLWGCYI